MNLLLMKSGVIDKELSEINSNVKTSLDHSYSSLGKEELKTDKTYKTFNTDKTEI